MRSILTIFISCLVLSAIAQRPAPDLEKVKGGMLSIQPISHASLVLSYKKMTIYIDPTGGAKAYKELASPGIIIITDIHGDHFDPKTIDTVKTANTIFIVPQAVAYKLSPAIDKQKVVILKNGDKTEQNDISIEALPMYNLPEATDSRHTKGRGNGYVISIKGKRIYISGDTEDIPEMRALKNIDIAFVCMNLPYTMDVNQASQGVLAFKPKVVYPYHYRGQDVDAFKALVNDGDKNIEVRLRNWYPAVN